MAPPPHMHYLGKPLPPLPLGAHTCSGPAHLQNVPGMWAFIPYEQLERAQGRRQGSSSLNLDGSAEMMGLPGGLSGKPHGGKDVVQLEPRSSCASFPTRDSSGFQLCWKPRYYEQALAPDDKHALAQGEHNHNLKTYSKHAVVKHYDARKELVPRGYGPDNTSLKDKKQQVKRQPLAQPSGSRLSRKLSFDTAPEILSIRSHARHVSHVDSCSSLSAPQSALPTPPASGPPSPMPWPIVPRSSIATLASTHSHNPGASFDAFLVPHKSGKGETIRGSANAKKEKPPKKCGSTLQHSELASSGPSPEFSVASALSSFKNRRSPSDL
ncbi:hypothetical protein ACEQ8H_005890 [Pleosporales sp. CAS-2024a]